MIELSNQSYIFSQGGKKMKRIKLKKGYIAGVLALLLIVATVALPSAYGAGAIDTQAECSLTLHVGEGDQFKEDLSKLTLQASLYRVADISETGVYTTVQGKFDGLDLSGIDSTTTAMIWQEKAAAADKIVEEAGEKPDADYIVEMNGGTGSQSGIAQGMYLVRVATVQNDLYEYSFMPFLISVPNNQFYQTGNDSWIYDVAVDIKPEQTPRTGAVEIIKTVSVHNADLGTAMFVFQIDAVNPDGENVYSNVAGISFDAAGTKTLRVDGIPAGSTVTVTEIYSGSSYELVSGAQTQSAVITAEETQQVQFVNTYSEALIPGTGTVNHFEKDETDVQNNGWKWTQLTLSQNSTAKAALPQEEEAQSEAADENAENPAHITVDTEEAQIPQE